MSVPNLAIVHAEYGRDLSELLEAVLAGDLATVDRAVAVERQVVRSLGALQWLQQRHAVDEHGRCCICWRVSRKWWRLWPKRVTCTVHSALGFFLRQPERFVLSVITGRAAEVGDE